VRARLSEIDRSMRLPALFFLTSGLLWLLAGTFLALLASVSLHSPEFFPNWQWLTFGIVRSAHLNAMSYGWSNNAVFAVLTWIMARLCRTRIRHPEILITAGIFWNIGVTIGILGILRGDMTSVEWLEMPMYVAPILAVSFALVGVWNIIAFRFRQTDHIYVSQWYILGAMFGCPGSTASPRS
jgi:cytochrome c oxidase cbb3-type subunit 1